ncbi:MAG: S-layer homology domain-containing protein [Limnoraphis sp.]
MANSQLPFPDLTQHWARSFIQRLQRQNIVSGFQDGTFRPEQTLTRAEYAALLQAAFQRPPKRAYLPFSDVSTGFWAFSAIQNAYEAGFISGFPDNTFRPQANITRLHVLLSLVAGLNIPKTTAFSLAEVYKDADQIPNYAVSAISGATQSKIVVNYPQAVILNPNQPATRSEVAAIIYQALVFLGKALPLASPYCVEPTKPGIVRTGTHLSVNGRRWKTAWGQWSSGVSTLTGISDKGIMLVLGMNPLNNQQTSWQPIHWFSPLVQPVSMLTQFDRDYRYLNIDALAKTGEWEVEREGNTLNIFSEIGQINQITYEEFSDVSRMVINLNKATPWELYELSSDWEVVVDALTEKSIADRFSEAPPESTIPQPDEDQKNEGETSGSEAKIPRPVVKPGETQTVIKGKLPDGYGIKVFTLTNPNRIWIEVRKDALIERNILWTTGLNWRQQYLTLNQDRFPVVWLEVKRNSGLKLQPIWTDKTQMKGTASLSQITNSWGSLAAINGGYFNRNNLLPLGTIRQNNKWFSGPILNRGVMAWNDTGTVKMARLKLTETLTLSSGREFEIDLLNTGYVKAGIARYTPDWGKSYTPLTLNEVIITVENNQLSRQIESNDDQTPIEIPQNGYLLTFRSFRSALSAFPLGGKIAITAKTTPSEFNQYPHILGAGPLLLQQGQIVVDAEAEGFNIWFAKQRAIRSGIGVTANGDLLIVTVHNRVGGPGPDLTELAQLIQQLGAVEGLNLDGGSSTSLILGGHLLNRTADTAARVHNGLGLFWRSRN